MSQLTLSTRDAKVKEMSFLPQIATDGQPNFLKLLVEDLAAQVLRSELFGHRGSGDAQLAPPFNFNAEGLAKVISYYLIAKPTLSSAQATVTYLSNSDQAKDFLGSSKTMASIVKLPITDGTGKTYCASSADTYIISHYNWMVHRASKAFLGVTLSADDLTALQYFTTRLFDLVGADFGSRIKKMTQVYRTAFVRAVTAATRLALVGTNTFKAEETGATGYSNVISEISHDDDIFCDVIGLVISNPNDITGSTKQTSRHTGVTTAGDAPFGSWQAFFTYLDTHGYTSKDYGDRTQPWVKFVTAALESRGSYIAPEDLMDNADYGTEPEVDNEDATELAITKDKKVFNFGDMMMDTATDARDAALYQAYYRIPTVPVHDPYEITATSNLIKLAHIWTYENAAMYTPDYQYKFKENTTGVALFDTVRQAPGIHQCAGVKPTKDGISGTAPLSTSTWFDSYDLDHNEEKRKTEPTLDRALMIKIFTPYNAIMHKVIEACGVAEEYYFRTDTTSDLVIWTADAGLTIHAIDDLVNGEETKALVEAALTPEELKLWASVNEPIDEGDFPPTLSTVLTGSSISFVQGYVPAWLSAIFASMDGPTWIATSLPKKYNPGYHSTGCVIPTSFDIDPFTHTYGHFVTTTERSAQAEFATVRLFATEYDDMTDAERNSTNIKKAVENKDSFPYWLIIIIVLAIAVAIVVASRQKQRVELTTGKEVKQDSVPTTQSQQYL